MQTTENLSVPRLLAVLAATLSMGGVMATDAHAGGAQPPLAAAPESLWLAEAPVTSTGDEIVDILLAIGRIDGRMQAGMVLYQSKDRKGAIQHFRFARDKVYKPMAPQLQAHELPAFDEGIRALELASSPGQVAGAFLAVAKGLAAARGGIGASPAQQLTAVQISDGPGRRGAGQGAEGRRGQECRTVPGCLGSGSGRPHRHRSTGRDE